MDFPFNNPRTSFASGEVNPNIRAANDLARFQTGAEKVENLVVLIEAILTRRPGTRFLLEAKNQAQRGKMVAFRYAGSDYYVLAFNGGKMRVLKDEGFLESAPGTIYELSVPWVEADMAHLRSAAAGNVILQVAAGKPWQRLTRNGHTDWTIAEYAPLNGPIDTQNLDTAKTIVANGTTGSVDLLGVGTAFAAGQVGGVYRLDESDLSLLANWKADETLTIPTEAVPVSGTKIGDMTNPGSAFDGNPATSATKSATPFWLGFNLATPSAVYSVRVLGTQVAGPGGTLQTFTLYGKAGGLPANRTDGVVLGSVTQFFQNGFEAVITSTDANTAWDYLWVTSSASTDTTVSEFTGLRFTAGGVPVLRRYNGNVYQAISGSAAGLTPPTHEDGDVLSGPGGVIWRYRHRAYGFIKITAVTDATHATGTVVMRLPDSIATRPGYRWWPPAVCEQAGWPKQVAIHDDRACFFRDNTYWMTRPGTLDDFHMTALEDSAIARRLKHPEGYVQIEWALSSGVLVQGGRDQEWITRAPADNDALTAHNVRDIPDDGQGSAPQIPSPVDKGVIFAGKDGRRLHYIKIARLAQELDVQEVSVAARHIFGSPVKATAWQRDPHRILWIVLEDGTLAGCTFMPDEKIVGFHRHPMVNCAVEDIAAIPKADNGRTEIVLQTRRTIDGATCRYYELLMPFFEPANAAAPTAAGAWFVDCGLRYQGPPVASVAGADHLIGQTVAVFVDGAEQPRKVVSASGAVALDNIDLAGADIDVVIGLPIAWTMRDLPRDIVAGGQSSKGSPKRASHIVVDVRHSAGGFGRFNDSEPEALTETGAMDYGTPIGLFTGPVRITCASATADEGVLELSGDNAMPFTLLAVTPKLEIEEIG